MIATQAIPVAATWGGWWIGMGVCMLMMFVMMFGMMWHPHRREDDGRPPRWEDERPRSVGEPPLDVLERRFAEGSISVDDYQARREVLIGGAGSASGARKEERLVAPRAGEGGQE